MVNKIIIKKDINTDLGMRYLAERLFEKIDKKQPRIIIDFEDIEFMSRSFAQEYIYQKTQLRGIEFIEENKSVNVFKMFNVVLNSLK